METDGLSQPRSFIPQDTINKLVKYLWTRVNASSKFLKLNVLCQNFRDAEKVLETAEFLADEVKRCLFLEAVRIGTPHLKQVLTILYCLQIPVTMEVEEKVVLNGQVDSKKRIDEYLSEDKIIELGERDPKRIHEFLDFLAADCIEVTFKALDLTELFFVYRMKYTQKPVRPSYLKTRFDNLLAEFRNCQLDIGIKAMMLTGTTISDGTQKILNNVGIVERDTRKRIVRYTQKGTGFTLKKTYSSPEENGKKIVAYINAFRKSNGNNLAENPTVTPNEGIGAGVSRVPLSLKRRTEYEGNPMAKRIDAGVQSPYPSEQQNVNLKIALQELHYALFVVDGNIFQSLCQQVKSHIAFTSNDMEVDAQPIVDAVSVFLTQLKENLYENEAPDDSFSVAIVFHALHLFLYELESPKLLAILKQVEFDSNTFEATKMKVPTNICVEGFKKLFVACLPK